MDTNIAPINTKLILTAEQIDTLHETGALAGVEFVQDTADEPVDPATSPTVH